MAATASVVIVGGGIVGSSIAHYLVEKGLKDVVLLERDSIAAGATGLSGALVRMHYTNPWDAALSLKSLNVFANWDDLIGGDSGFRKTGFIVIVGPHDSDKLTKNVSMLRKVGVNTHQISLEDLKILQPFCDLEGVGAAAYEPDSGYADGYSAATAMARRARELGVRVRQGVEAFEIRRKGDKVVGVKTSEGDIDSTAVVLAAGAWSSALAGTAGVDLPVVGHRLMAGIVERPPEISEPHMTFIDHSLDSYFRPDVGDLTLLGVRTPRMAGPEVVDPDDFDNGVSEALQVRAARQLTHRIPAMIDARWRRSWAGVDGYTRDGHMLLGEVPGLEGLYLAAGMSGRGFKTGPAVGMCIAELILEGRAESADIHPFRVNRFEEGEPIASENEYIVSSSRALGSPDS